jgi:hypothetical protein
MIEERDSPYWRTYKTPAAFFWGANLALGRRYTLVPGSCSNRRLKRMTGENTE